MVKITATELLNRIDSLWATTEDIMIIGAVGRHRALKIKKKIEDAVSSKGKDLPRNLVPMELVIEHFNINVNYLKKVAKERNEIIGN